MRHQIPLLFVFLLLSLNFCTQAKPDKSTPEKVIEQLIELSEADRHEDMLKLMEGEVSNELQELRAFVSEKVPPTPQFSERKSEFESTLGIFSSAEILPETKKNWETKEGKWCSYKVQTSFRIGIIELVLLKENEEWNLFAIQ